MKVLDQNVEAKKVLSMINTRIEAVTTEYHYAVAKDQKIEAGALAETKWQLAELKVQFVDLLCDQIEQHQMDPAQRSRC